MLEARVQMRLETQAAHHAVMMAINVRVYAIQTFEDGANGGLEAARKRHAGTSGENGRIAEVVAGPSEQMRNVRRRGQSRGFGESRGVVPQVFELFGGFHLGTGRWGAEFGDGAVEQIDLVVEVDDCGMAAFDQL